MLARYKKTANTKNEDKMKQIIILFLNNGLNIYVQKYQTRDKIKYGSEIEIHTSNPMNIKIEQLKEKY